VVHHHQHIEEKVHKYMVACMKARTTLRELHDENLQVDEAQQALVPYNYLINKIMAN
jgi:hypothetical protein